MASNKTKKCIPHPGINVGFLKKRMTIVANKTENGTNSTSVPWYNTHLGRLKLAYLAILSNEYSSKHKVKDETRKTFLTIILLLLKLAKQ